MLYLQLTPYRWSHYAIFTIDTTSVGSLSVHREEGGMQDDLFKSGTGRRVG